MNKKFYILMLCVMSVSISFGQKGNNQIIGAVDVGLPVGDFGDYKVGVGVIGKILFGFSDHSQIGFTTGYTAFKLDEDMAGFKQKTSIVPFLATYRHHFSILFVEPQLGFGKYTTTTKDETTGSEIKITNSDGAFTWGIGAGIQVSAIDFGIRYQSGAKDGGSIGYFGIHAGYIFQGGRK
jgi:hypothetical protein